MARRVVLHRAIKVVRLRLCPAERSLTDGVVISTADVDHDFQEIQSLPRRGSDGLQKAPGAVEDVRLEREIESELIFDVNEVPPGLEEDGQGVVERRQSFGLAAVDSPAGLPQLHEMCVRTLHAHKKS